MKLLFDQNLSHKLPALLAAVFPGSAHVRDFNLQSADDRDVWQFARANGFIITSKDESSAIVSGCPRSVSASQPTCMASVNWPCEVKL